MPDVSLIDHATGGATPYIRAIKPQWRLFEKSFHTRVKDRFGIHRLFP
jgi:hypothetical protein